MKRINCGRYIDELGILPIIATVSRADPQSRTGSRPFCKPSRQVETICRHLVYNCLVYCRGNAPPVGKVGTCSDGHYEHAANTSYHPLLHRLYIHISNGKPPPPHFRNGNTRLVGPIILGKASIPRSDVQKTLSAAPPSSLFSSLVICNKTLAPPAMRNLLCPCGSAKEVFKVYNWPAKAEGLQERPSLCCLCLLSCHPAASQVLFPW